MEKFTTSWKLLTAAFLLTLLLLHQSQTASALNTTNTNTNTEARKTVKKDQALPPLPPSGPEPALLQPTEPSPEKVVVISEKPQRLAPVSGDNGHPSISHLPAEDVHIERTKVDNNGEIPETYAAVFYVLVGITSSAILLLSIRIYRLRLSRAERKYGVQGDRANQELTPLPMAIEDVNSDEEEDHTLFEVNRQSIRIL